VEAPPRISSLPLPVLRRCLFLFVILAKPESPYWLLPLPLLLSVPRSCLFYWLVIPPFWLVIPPFGLSFHLFGLSFRSEAKESAFSVACSCCHPERAQRVEGPRRSSPNHNRRPFLPQNSGPCFCRCFARIAPKARPIPAQCRNPWDSTGDTRRGKENAIFQFMALPPSIRGGQ